MLQERPLLLWATDPLRLLSSFLWSWCLFHRANHANDQNTDQLFLQMSVEIANSSVTNCATERTVCWVVTLSITVGTPAGRAAETGGQVC
jgi:hypothetical protein